MAARLPYPYLITVQGLFTLFTGLELVDASATVKFTAWMEKRSLSVAKQVTADQSFPQTTCNKGIRTLPSIILSMPPIGYSTKSSASRLSLRFVF